MTDTGGLIQIAFVIGWLLYGVICRPFRELNMAMSYDKLVNEIKGVSEENFHEQVGCCFSLWYILYVTLPKCMRPLFCMKKKNHVKPRTGIAEVIEDVPTFKEIYDYFEQVNSEAKYKLSLRHLLI